MSAGCFARQFLAVALLLCLISACSSDRAKAKATTPAPSSCTSKESTLCTELLELRDLIPASTLIYITTKHYLHDVRFQHATRFLRSNDFAKLADKIECSGPFNQILQQFEANGVNSYLQEVGNITGLLDCLLVQDPTCEEKPQNDSLGNLIDTGKEFSVVLKLGAYTELNIGKHNAAGMGAEAALTSTTAKVVQHLSTLAPAKENMGSYAQKTIVKSNSKQMEEVGGEQSKVVEADADIDESVEEDTMTSRSFQSYLGELMKAMPRWQFREAIENKARENKEFAQFYKTMRNDDFRRLVLDNLNSHQMMIPIYKLKKNYIELPRVLLMIFRIFSWGPSIQQLEHKLRNKKSRLE